MEHLGIDHLVKLIPEQGAKIYTNNHNKFLDSNTPTPERLGRTKHTIKTLP
jgi:hypothetical protein